MQEMIRSKIGALSVSQHAFVVMLEAAATWDFKDDSLTNHSSTRGGAERCLVRYRTPSEAGPRRSAT